MDGYAANLVKQCSTKVFPQITTIYGMDQWSCKEWQSDGDLVLSLLALGSGPTLSAKGEVACCRLVFQRGVPSYVRELSLLATEPVKS